MFGLFGRLNKNRLIVIVASGFGYRHWNTASNHPSKQGAWISVYPRDGPARSRTTIASATPRRKNGDIRQTPFGRRR